MQRGPEPSPQLFTAFSATSPSHCLSSAGSGLSSPGAVAAFGQPEASFAARFWLSKATPSPLTAGASNSNEQASSRSSFSVVQELCVGEVSGT